MIAVGGVSTGRSVLRGGSSRAEGGSCIDEGRGAAGIGTAVWFDMVNRGAIPSACRKSGAVRESESVVPDHRSGSLIGL